MARKIAFILSLFIVFSLNQLAAQRTDSWKEKKENELFIEGTYALPVSASVQLISFHSMFQAFDTEQEQDLYFEVYAPANEPYLLKVQERRILKFYMLESQPGEINEGRNNIGPWKPNDVAGDLKIPAKNLGALFRLKADDSDYVLPVSVKEKDASDDSDSYKALLRLSKRISKGSYSVYLGEHTGDLSDIEAVQNSKIGKHRSGSILQLSIDIESLKDYEGWVTVNVSLNQYNSRTKIPKTFYFYHCPKDS